MKKLRNILITGGAGFIGSHLVDRLIKERTWLVTVLDNFDDFYLPEIKFLNLKRYQNNPRFKLIKADICDSDRLGAYLRESRPACVVHLAARTGVRQSLGQSELYSDTNIKGTLTLLEMIRNYGVEQFINVSSAAVYGLSNKLPLNEEDTPRPISPYGMTKAAAELICHTYSHLYNLRCVCLRLFSVYGPRQRPDLAVHKFVKLIVEGRPIPAYGLGKIRDYTYIDDIIGGIRLAMDYKKTMFEIVNLGGSKTLELAQLIHMLEAALETNAIIQRLPMRPGDQPHAIADITKARRLFGYEPKTEIEDGIRHFIGWFKDGQISNLTDIESFRRTRKAGAT